MSEPQIPREKPIVASAHPKAIVLAGGPKGTRRAPLRRCLDRTSALVGSRHVFPVLPGAGRLRWPVDWPSAILEPDDRGSAVALLLGLFHVAGQCEPREPIVVLSAQHHVTDEQAWSQGLLGALSERFAAPGRVLALAAIPRRAAPGLDWMVLEPRRPPAHGRRVARVVERADESDARALMSGGALIGTGTLVSSLQDLFYLFEGTLPDLLGRFRRALWWGSGAPAAAVAGLYRDLPRYDLGHDVLARGSEWLEAYPVPPPAEPVGSPPERALEPAVRDRGRRLAAQRRRGADSPRL